jgi:hypothetical protein
MMAARRPLASVPTIIIRSSDVLSIDTGAGVKQVITANHFSTQRVGFVTSFTGKHEIFMISL